MGPLLLTAALSAMVFAAVYFALAHWSRRIARRTDIEQSDTEEAVTRLALTPVVLGVLAVAALALGLLAILVERKTFVRGWDEDAESWAARNTDNLAADVLRWLTDLGATVTVMALSVAVALVIALRTRRWALIAFLATVVLGQWLLSNLIKWGVDRARPNLDQLVSASGASFPSGHTTSAAACYLAMALALAAAFPRLNQRALIAGAAAIAVAVACSRVLLGVHWFTDVMGGLLLGWGWCIAVAALFGLHVRRAARASSPSGAFGETREAT